MWASLVLSWHAILSWTALAARYWPTDGALTQSQAAALPTAVGQFSAPLFVGLLALALAQLLAAANAYERD